MSVDRRDIALMSEGDFLCHCPFCKRRLHVARDAAGEAEGLIHELPTCSKFERLDPGDFIVEVRRRLEAEVEGN